jgi:SAM-dependent methyltransferase
MKSVSACPVCGGGALRPFSSVPEPPNGGLHFAQVRCARCSLVISQPQATDSGISEYYRRAYYEVHWPDARAVWLANAARHRRVTMPSLEKLWDGWIGRRGAALEVGCGYGAMLGALADSGFDAIGLDPSARALRFCASKGFRVVLGVGPEFPLQPAQFDLVVARHVIEHVADPVRFVASLARLARPGGVIALETENIWTSQYLWDRCRAAFAGRPAPFRSSTDHTYVFDAAHLRRFLEGAGCREVRTRVFDERPDRESLHWRLYKGLFRSIDQIAGMGEYLLAVGRKAAA